MIYDCLMNWDDNKTESFFNDTYNCSLKLNIEIIDNMVKNTKHPTTNDIINIISFHTVNLIQTHLELQQEANIKNFYAELEKKLAEKNLNIGFEPVNFTYTPDLQESFELTQHSIIMILYNIKRFIHKDDYIPAKKYLLSHNTTTSSSPYYTESLSYPINYFVNNFTNRWSYPAFDFSKKDAPNGETILVSNFLPDLLLGEYNCDLNLEYKRTSKQDKRDIVSQLEKLDLTFENSTYFRKSCNPYEKLLYFYKWEYIYGIELLRTILYEFQIEQTDFCKTIATEDEEKGYTLDKNTRNNLLQGNISDEEYLIISQYPNVLSRSEYVAKYYSNNTYKYILNHLIPLYEKTVFILLTKYWKEDLHLICKYLEEYVDFQLTNELDLKTPMYLHINYFWNKTKYTLNSLNAHKDKTPKKLLDIYNNIQVPAKFHPSIKPLKINQRERIIKYFKTRYSQEWWSNYAITSDFISTKRNS